MSFESAQSPNITDDSRRLRRAFLLSVSFAAVLWLVKLSELLAGFDLARGGVYPRRIDALPGILLAPLIHGSLAHLFSNTAPIIILGTALLYGYPKSARIALPALFLGPGLASISTLPK